MAYVSTLINILLMLLLAGLSVVLPGYDTFYYRGNSMDNEFNHFGLSNKYNGQQLEEGDTITYDGSEFNSSNLNRYVGHRIIKKYESYNPDEAEYYTLNVDDENVDVPEDIEITHLFNWLFIGPENTFELTSKPKNVSSELVGETVYILKGDNNKKVDPFLITESEIAYIHTNIRFPINK